MKNLKRFLMIGAIGATGLSLGTAQAALQDRDLDGDTVTDAFYDTDLDITWLRNANVNGTMHWNAAVAWADGFSFAGFDDWRLPTSDTCGGNNCTGSEMGHLFYTELGNSAGSMTNPGGFQNWTGWYYWTGTEWAVNPAGWAWVFGPMNGYQDANVKYLAFGAMAVANGDIGMVPEPETYALMLVGLAAVGATARRNARRP